MSVHVASKNKKGNDEIICAKRLSSILFEKTITKNFETKSVFFPEKRAVFLTLSTSEMKKLLHPSEISVKC